MAVIQIFGLKRSPATRAAERFFKERRAPLQLVDLALKPMAPAEINRFITKFGLLNLIDQDSKTYQNAGLKYMKLSSPEWIGRIEQEPALLRLPLVRSGNLLSIGQDEDLWKEILSAQTATAPRKG